MLAVGLLLGEPRCGDRDHIRQGIRNVVYGVCENGYGIDARPTTSLNAARQRFAATPTRLIHMFEKKNQPITLLRLETTTNCDGDGEIRLHFYSACGGRGIEIEVFTSF